MSTETKTLRSLCRKVKISNKYGARTPHDKQDDWQQSATGWTVTLRYQGRQMTVDFWMGSGLSREPDARGVLDCLLSDASAGEQDFDEFCREFGYDEDSRKAERTWKACAANAVKLQRLLGDDYETFLHADRNDD